MAMIDLDEPIRTFVNKKNEIDKFMFITFKNKVGNIITQKIKINKIVYVYIGKDLIDTFAEYEYSYISNKINFLFFKKEVLKKIIPKPSYYTGKIYLNYEPKNVLPLEMLFDSEKDSIKYYNNNKKYVDNSTFLNILSKHS